MLFQGDDKVLEIGIKVYDCREKKNFSIYFLNKGPYTFKNKTFNSGVHGMSQTPLIMNKGSIQNHLLQTK